ncbi:DUF4825 domain-containing protein [Anaerosalibacter massiliensis]|uniref:DUF4825 domain-containing protein n=1 Tax=Anaerosalibacter massiliensis TaxID=1347392 RepID=A0A9X2S6X1_9FIRM|nr:DUF4825 domain-containing protein [Anaerosalibacter massiliensis]MCR2043561.1 DUF4825 domain-containing protein [Anaerosalibacter massiliensis]
MNKKILIILLCVMVITSIIFLKDKLIKNSQDDNSNQEEILKSDIENLSKYKSKYMGDASNFSNLNNKIALHDIPMTFKLHPDELMAEINYKESVSNIDEGKLKRGLVYNSTVNFVLIDNLKVLKLNFKEVSYTISREKLDEWYGVELPSLEDKEQWKKEVSDKLSDMDHIEKFIHENMDIENK